MRILFIVPYIPSQIYVRPYNLIRYLAKRKHQITLLTLGSPEQDRAALDELRQVCEKVHVFSLPRWRSLMNSALALPTKAPLQSRYCWQPELAGFITKSLEHPDERPYDIIHVEHLRGVQYALLAKKLQKQGRLIHSAPIIWDSVDNISHLFRQAAAKSQKFSSRLLSILDLSRTERYEGWLVDQFDRTLVTSAQDRQAFERLSHRPVPHPIEVLPNGVDLDFFTPGDPGEKSPAAIVISGKMSYHANISMVLNFARNILPLVWKERPDAELWIVGKDPVREILELGSHPQITVTGTVSDIRPFLRKATVAVTPITYGTGIQNKVLEAMACGVPVVSTSKAIAALNVTPGKEILVDDTLQGFANHVLSLIADPDLQIQISDAGKTYVIENHHWAQIAAQLDTIYADCMRAR